MIKNKPAPVYFYSPVVELDSVSPKSIRVAKEVLSEAGIKFRQDSVTKRFLAVKAPGAKAKFNVHVPSSGFTASELVFAAGARFLSTLQS
jgi:hypothetical protein